MSKEPPLDLPDAFRPSSIGPYGWRDSVDPCNVSYINPKILRILPRTCSKILDLGCGNGALCHLLHSELFNVVGMEPDLNGIQICKERLPSVPFYQLGVNDDPSLVTANEGLFDAVVSTEVIEHLYAPHLLPRFAWSCLKPGGLLVISTPYHGYIKNLSLSLAGKWDHHHTALWTGGHIKFWSRSTLTQLVVEERFIVEQFLGVGRLPWLWKSMILVARRPMA